MRFRINEKSEFLGLYFKLYAYCHHSNIILFIHFPFHTTDIRRTSGRSLGTFNKVILYSSTLHIKMPFTTPFVFKWFQ
jgi:hypothetical protein